ncbi:hypothetical protein B0A55_06167 [Friedmanniomyces simplex]|uniref:Uncharacterized protein n=1 Tax=Friedmanniomyces simplex TaxID=329884 RepID=A0A4U0XCY9_9PEZI|nr:hypothetical protein B0A55_06167 [Friedmanniomyces simplex]
MSGISGAISKADVDADTNTDQGKRHGHTPPLLTSYHILKPGEWPFDFYQALLDFAEQEADRDVAYPYIDAHD